MSKPIDNLMKSGTKMRYKVPPHHIITIVDSYRKLSGWVYIYKTHKRGAPEGVRDVKSMHEQYEPLYVNCSRLWSDLNV